MEKTCTKCGKTKELTEFHKQRNQRDGVRAVCKLCRSEAGDPARKARNEAYIETHREELNAYRRRYYQAHKPEARAYAKAYAKAHYDPAKHAASAKKYYQKNRERLLAYKKERRKANPELARESARKARRKYYLAHKEEREMRHQSIKGDAVIWLTSRLAGGVSVDSRTIREEGAKLGFNKSALLRAAKELDVLSSSVAGQYGRRTNWSL